MNADNMSTQGSFSFRAQNSNGHRQRRINDNLFLRIFRLDENIVEMYFVDSQGSRIDVPVGLKVTNSMTLATVPLYSNTQTFALAWSESYAVTTSNGSNKEITIARFSNQRQWSIHSSEPFDPVSSDITENNLDVDIEHQTGNYDETGELVDDVEDNENLN